ncbi:MAG: phosphoribosylformimino-5-aminoimidazole carboxamide ribotide isomerase [Gaiellaceae bacterium]|nr:phosphoribosylformimino-5-aminoimidazole carboxamide ribotide isomerase [Gaiellaceae bacterium]
MLQTFAIIPAVDVLDGRAVRLHQGDYDRIEVDAGDPLALVRQAAAAAPPLVHVVALGAARDGGAPVELARAVVEAAAPVPVQLGGGVRSVDDVKALAAAGVARVMIGTAAFGDVPLDEFVAAAELVVAIDVAGGIVRTAGWLASSGLTTAQALERCAGAGVGHLLCTAIDRDGTRSGPDLQLLREVRSFNGTVLAAGGIRDDADVEAVRALGIDGVVVGRAWLEGDLTLSS